MTTVRRLSDSCLLVTTDSAATLIDPGFHPFTESGIDLDSIGDVSRVLITHEHRDHVHPGFVRWLLQRGDDVRVYSNQAVAELLAEEDIEVTVGAPEGVAFEDSRHETLPDGSAPPNRAFTLDDLLTHPGDSRGVGESGPVLALPLLAPWGSLTGAVEFARRLAPDQIIGIHDFYLSQSGRERIRELARKALQPDGIEVVEVDWGASFSI